MTPFFAAVHHNTFFRSLVIEDVSRKEVIPMLAKVVRHNRTLTKLALTGLGSSNSWWLVGDQLCNNEYDMIQVIDFSNNSLGTKAVLTLGRAIQHFSHGLKVLNLSNCSISSKGIIGLMNSFSRNYGVSLSLEVLNLSYNKMDDPASKALEDWLYRVREHSQLRELILAKAGLNITSVGKSLRALAHLERIVLDRNKVDQGAAQLVAVACEYSSTLRELSLARCGLCGEDSQTILRSLLTNSALSGLKINLAGNKFDDKDIQACTLTINRGLSQIHTIDLSNSRLKEKGFVALLRSISQAESSTLDTLILDNAYAGSGTSSAVEVAKWIASLLNSAPNFQALSMAGGYDLKLLQPFLEALQTAPHLLELNVSKNKMGDKGASYLANAMRMNTTLQFLNCDENQIGLNGWLSILAAFRKNKTIHRFTYPWFDFERIVDTLEAEHQLKLIEVMGDIQEAADLNVNADTGRLFVLEKRDAPTVYEAPTHTLPLCPVPEALLRHQEQAMLVDIKATDEDDIQDAARHGGSGDRFPAAASPSSSSSSFNEHNGYSEDDEPLPALPPR